MSVQLSAPRWVVARAVSLYQMAAFGGIAAGAWTWGAVAERHSLAHAFYAAAIVLLACAAMGLRFRLAQSEAINLEPLRQWSEPNTIVPGVSERTTMLPSSGSELSASDASSKPGSGGVLSVALSDFMAEPLHRRPHPIPRRTACVELNQSFTRARSATGILARVATPTGVVPMRWPTLLLAALVSLLLAACAALPGRDPLRVELVGIEPIEGQGLELRLAVKLRVQNPNEEAVEYDGAALDLEVNGKSLAYGVSDQRGSVVVSLLDRESSTPLSTAARRRETRVWCMAVTCGAKCRGERESGGGVTPRQRRAVAGAACGRRATIPGDLKMGAGKMSGKMAGEAARRHSRRPEHHFLTAEQCRRRVSEDRRSVV